MNELIRKLVKEIQLIWIMLTLSMVAYIPVVYLIVKKERLKGSAPGHLEGMWPIFLLASFILGAISILQYNKSIKSERLQIKIKLKNCPIEEYFKDKKTGKISKSIEGILERLDENQKRLLHLPSLYWKPVLIGLGINELVVISGMCLSLSTHSFFLIILFVSLGLFFSLFILPKQRLVVDTANNIYINR